MIEHTLGPWIVGDGHQIIANNGRHVADVHSSMKDARLIAAAPDLLAALKEFVEGAALPAEFDDPGSLLADARAAIVKATGRALSATKPLVE